MAAYTIWAFAKTLREEGYPVETWLKEAGLSPQAISDDGLAIDVSQLLRFVLLIHEYCPDPSIFLKVGRGMNVTTYGILGYAMMASRNLQEAWQLGEDYSALIGDSFLENTFNLSGPAVEIVFQPRSNLSALAVNALEEAPQEDLPWQFAANVEIGMSSFLEQSRNITAGRFQLTSAELSYPDPGYGKTYQDLLGCPVTFEARQCVLRVSRKEWLAPLPFANDITLDHCLETCEQLFAQQLGQHSLAQKTRALLVPDDEGYPTLEDIAIQLHLSARSLRRRLEEHGTSFQRILDGVRRDSARELLETTGLSVEQIATRLGYSEASNFRSAFKRWTGHTPTAFRKSRMD